MRGLRCTFPNRFAGPVSWIREERKAWASALASGEGGQSLQECEGIGNTLKLFPWQQTMSFREQTRRLITKHFKQITLYSFSTVEESLLALRHRRFADYKESKCEMTRERERRVT